MRSYYDLFDIYILSNKKQKRLALKKNTLKYPLKIKTEGN